MGGSCPLLWQIYNRVGWTLCLRSSCWSPVQDLHRCSISVLCPAPRPFKSVIMGRGSCPSPGPRWPEPFVPVSLSLCSSSPLFMVPSHLYFTNILRSCGAIKDLLSSRRSQVDFKLGDTLFQAALGLNNIKLNTIQLRFDILVIATLELIRCQSISCTYRIETNVCYWPDPLDYMIIVVYSLWFWADVGEINVFFFWLSRDRLRHVFSRRITVAYLWRTPYSSLPISKRAELTSHCLWIDWSRLLQRATTKFTWV